MNWIRIDCDVYATEIAGAGCFVRFYGHVVPVFAPGVTIRTTKIKQKEVHALVAAPFSGTHVSFTTDTMTTPTGSGWVGNAGDRLDQKLAEYERKQWRADKVAKNRPVKYNKIVNKRVGKKVTATRVRG